MFKILTHSRAAKLKLTARTCQSISLRQKSGKGNNVLNSHPTPTPTQPHMSAFSKAPPPLRVLLLCAFPSSGRSWHCRFARALCARGAARRREDTGGGQGGKLQKEEAQKRTIRKRSESRLQSPRVGSFCFCLVSIELLCFSQARFAFLLVKATRPPAGKPKPRSPTQPRLEHHAALGTRSLSPMVGAMV